MVYYEPIKVIIDISGLVEVIIDIIVRHHGLPNSIMNDWDSIFISKFWFLLYYFLGIKQNFSKLFHLQINSQTKR